VVVYAHGTGGSYRSFINNGTASALAAEGIAAISIDQTLHGPRNPGGNPEVDFFNFQNPLAARDNTLQGALDDFQLVRLVTGFDFTDPNNREIRFDSDKIFFFGHSQGGLTGVPFVAFEPLIKGAVFSGAGGVLILSLLNKTEPIDITALVAVVVRDVPLDEFNPLLGLVQGFLDRADSASYGPLVALRPPAGNAPKHVFHSMGLIDNFTPVPSIEALATSLGVSPVTPVIQDVPGIDLAGVDAVDPPVTGNLDGTTAVLLEYQAPAGRDGHFVLFDVPAGRTQSIQFLSTLAQSGTPTVPTP
jgi:pimeloyl-ACP methyl ester carboxylesterase